MESSCRCDVFKIDVHRASYAKHFTSEEQSEIRKLDDKVKCEWLFKEKPVENKI